MRIPFLRHISLSLALVMSMWSVVPRVEAAIAPSQALFGSVSEAASARDADLDVIRKILEEKVVSQRLGELGYQQSEIESRLSMLSDNEVHRLASTLDQVHVGGDAVGFIVGLVILVLVVFGVLYLLDRRVSIR